MNAHAIVLYVSALALIGLLVGIVVLARRYGAAFFQQAIAMAATVGTHAERFLRRGASAASRARSKTGSTLEDFVSGKKGLAILGVLIFPIWFLAVRTARNLDAQLLHDVFENKSLANGLSFLLIAFTSIAGFIITDLITPVKLPFIGSSRNARVGLVAALLVLIPMVATIQINLANDRANTIQASALLSNTANARTLTEQRALTTAPDELAVLDSRLESLSDARNEIVQRTERQRRQGITGGLVAAAVEALTSFSLPLAFLMLIMATLWLIDLGLGAAAGLVALLTLLIRAIPGLFRRNNPVPATAAAAPGSALPPSPAAPGLPAPPIIGGPPATDPPSAQTRRRAAF